MTLERDVDAVFREKKPSKRVRALIAKGVGSPLSTRAQNSIAEYVAFPIDVLPELLRTVVTEEATALGCDPSMIALPALASCASAIGTTRALRLKNSWREFPILWCVVVARSGTLKSPAHEHAVRPIQDAQTQRMREYDAAYEKYKEERHRYEADLKIWKNARPDKRGVQPKEPVPPICVRYVVADTTIEALAPVLRSNPRGVLLSKDELAGWLSGFNQYKPKGGSDVSNWLELYRGGKLTVDRKSTNPPVIFVAMSAVSVCGTIQPKTLRRVLTREFFENGLAARMLLAAPPTKRKHWTEADIPLATERLYAGLIDKLLTLTHGTDDRGELVPVLISLTPEARKLWIGFYNEFAGEQETLHDDDLNAAFAKIEGCAVRFALVFHLIRWATSPDRSEGPIDAECMAAAIKLARWFAHETERVYATFRENDSDRSARELAEYIGSRGGRITVRELQQGNRNYKDSAGKSEKALEDLVRRGFGSWEAVPTTTRGGQPTRVFVLHPPSTVYGTPETPEENDGCVDVDKD